MNLQQLEYIIAVDRYRHFAKAAEACFVTQPTLSMMVQKLEEELGVKIFDRARKPVTPTREGAEIIARARELLTKASSLKTFAAELKGEIKGELHMGIIPTLAPYLLPLFLKTFTQKYPHLRIFIREMITTDITDQLKAGKLDIGLLATPLHDQQLLEYPLFYEEFYAYTHDPAKPGKSKMILPREIDIHQLWLLEEGHCMRNQVFDLCELKKKDNEADKLHYEAGSIETLINLVDNSQGITIVPHLATLLLKPSQQKKIREFTNPKPVREISLVTVRDFPRKTLLDNLSAVIRKSIPLSLSRTALKPKQHSIVPVNGTTVT